MIFAVLLASKTWKMGLLCCISLVLFLQVRTAGPAWSPFVSRRRRAWQVMTFLGSGEMSWRQQMRLSSKVFERGEALVTVSGAFKSPSRGEPNTSLERASLEPEYLQELEDLLNTETSQCRYRTCWISVCCPCYMHVTIWHRISDLWMLTPTHVCFNHWLRREALFRAVLVNTHSHVTAKLRWYKDTSTITLQTNSLDVLISHRTTLPDSPLTLIIQSTQQTHRERGLKFTLYSSSSIKLSSCGH